MGASVLKWGSIMTEWVKGAFTPSMRDESKPIVGCYIFRGVIAVHKSLHYRAGGWQVSHVGSGLGCGSLRFARKADAQRFAERLYALEPEVWGHPMPRVKHLAEPVRCLTREFSYCCA
jgi:hypothetical protein